MKKRRLSPWIIVRALLILATLFALSSLPMTYGVFEFNGDNKFSSGLRPLTIEYLRGIDMEMPFVAIGLQLLLSGLIIFLAPKTWLRIVLLIGAVAQLAFILLFVTLEIAFRYFLAATSQGFGWGYRFLIIASVLMITACIMNFFVKRTLESNPDLLDEQL